ncbi:MAG: hypothetical protein HY807_05165 [Nitrospirae bacterium]|nr:hypothetical protein [Nitrospirota bacterium]
MAMKIFNQRQNKLIFILLMLMMVVRGGSGWAEAQKDTQAKQDELVCGDTRIVSELICPAEIDSVDFFNSYECEQNLFITNEQKLKTYIEGRIWSWGCVEGNKTKYIAITYDTGGNGRCGFFHWTDVYDLKGEFLMSDYFKSSSVDEALCALSYVNGCEDFKNFCEGLSKSAVSKIKNEVNNWKINREKIEELIGKDEKFLKQPNYGYKREE